MEWEFGRTKTQLSEREILNTPNSTNSRGYKLMELIVDPLTCLKQLKPACSQVGTCTAICPTLILPYSTCWLTLETEGRVANFRINTELCFHTSHMWYPKLTWGWGKLPALKSITGSFHTLFNEFFNPPWSSYTQVHGTLLQQLYLLLDLFQDGRE